MKAAKTWCLAGLMFVAGLSSASCGKDEGSDGSGGKGMIIGGSGGSSGKGGAGGSRVTGGNANAGGEPTVAATTKLGRACVSDTECKDPKAPDLKCVTAKQTVLGDGAPPKGLCTMPCTLRQQESDVDACAALGPGALCLQFVADSPDGYCVEGCTFGKPDISETKCHSRAEFACNPLFADTGEACTTDSQCQAGELCLGETCQVVESACLPACRGDIDCDAGTYCDQSLFSGVCVTKKQTGKGLGEPCTIPPANQPNEPDECLGFCQADGANSTKGHCATNCGFAQECAWNAATQTFDGLCAFGSILTPDDIGQGDFGFCMLSCNCTTDCKDATLGCSLSLLDEMPLPSDTFTGAGLCFTPDAKTVEYNQCGMGGAGAGGDSGTGIAGAGGAP